MAQSGVYQESMPPRGMEDKFAAARQRAETAKSVQKNRPSTAATTMAVADILARLREADELKRQAMAPAVEITEEVIAAAEMVTADQQQRRSDLAELEAAVKAGSLPREQGKDLMGALEAGLREGEQYLGAFFREYPALGKIIAGRARARQTIRELRTSVARLKLGVTKFGDLRDCVSDAVREGVLAVKAGGRIVLGHGQQAMAYDLVAVSDPVAAELAEQFVGALAGFLADFYAAGDRVRDSKVAEVAEFLLSREQVALLKEHEGTTRSLGQFFAGKGQYIFVPFSRHDPRSGQVRFLGEALIERRNGEMVATKATTQEAAHRIFGWWDKSQDAWRRHGTQTVVVLKKDDGGYDFDAIRNHALREALEEKYRKDEAYQGNRDAAAQLRDVSSVEGELGTMAEVFAGKKGITAVVNVRLSPDQQRSVGGRMGGRMQQRDDRVWVTLHVHSDGKQAYIAQFSPDNIVDRIVWLKQWLEPRGVDMMKQDRQWLYVEAQNQGFEADWLVHREIARRGAVVELSAENVDGLVSLLEGTDGLYALTRASYKSPQARYSTPIRVIMERKGGELAVMWVAPGFSWRHMHDKATGDSYIGKFYPVADLPMPIRDLVRNQYRFFKGLGGEEGLKQVPAHLLRPKAIDLAHEEPDDMPDGGGNGDHGGEA